MPEPNSSGHRMQRMEVDESPALRAHYEEFRGWLEGDLKKFTPAQVEAARKAAQDIAASEFTSPELHEHYADLERVFRMFAELQAAKDKDSILERLAKRDVVALANAEQVVSGEFENEVYHLSKTVFYLAQTQFPVDYKRQVEAREAKSKSDVEKRRDELMKKRVS